MQVSREFKVGLLVVLCALLAFIGINFFKTFDFFSTSREFSVEFGSISGLEELDQVQLNGVEIGAVSSVELKEDDASRVIVAFMIWNGGLKIPVNSEIWLVSSDILGTKALDLRIPDDSLLNSATSYYKSGDRFHPKDVYVALSIEDEFERQIGPIRKKTKELVTRVEDIIFSINAFWDTSAAYTIDASLYDVRIASVRYQELADNITSLIAKETLRAQKLGKNFKQIRKLISDHDPTLISITDDINRVRTTISKANVASNVAQVKLSYLELSQTLANVKEGEGSIGSLTNGTTLKDQIAITKKLFTDLEDKLEADPVDFVGFSIFGLKSKGYQPSKPREKLLDGVLDSMDKGRFPRYKK